MKIQTLLFAIFLLNISIICICTNAHGEEGNIPPAENIYPPSPNEQQGAGEANGPQQAAVYNENNFDEILEYDSEELRQMMASFDEIENEGNTPPMEQQSMKAAEQQFIDSSNLNAPNQQSPLLALPSENLSNQELATNIGQESQFDKGKAPIIGSNLQMQGKKPVTKNLDKGKKPAVKMVDKRKKPIKKSVDKGKKPTRSLSMMHFDDIFPNGWTDSMDENVPHSSPAQQQMMNQNPTMDDLLAEAFENLSEDTLDSTNDENVPHSSPTQQQIMDSNLPMQGTTEIAKNLDKGKKAVKKSFNKGKKENRSVAQMHLEDDMLPNECSDSAQQNMEQNPIHNIRPNIAERPYPCRKCGMRFTTNGYLTRHLNKPCTKNINDKKEFECRFSECNKKFASKKRRWEHEKIHKSEPYKCTFPGCTKEFLYESSRRQHMETHQEKVVCENCKESFVRKKYLKEHLRTCDKGGNNMRESDKGPME